MIVHDVAKAETEEGEILEVNIYLRFVSNRLNYISPEFARVVQKDKKSVKYELQLIPLTLPSRYMYMYALINGLLPKPPSFINVQT